MDEIVDLVNFDEFPLKNMQNEIVEKEEEYKAKKRKNIWISEPSVPKSERLQKKAFEEMSDTLIHKDVVVEKKKRGRPKGMVYSFSKKKINQHIIRISTEEAFVKKIKNRSHISYLKDTPIPIIKYSVDYAYQDQCDLFDQMHIFLPEDTSKEIREMTISFLQKTRKSVPMTNESYDYLAKTLISKIYQYWIENHYKWNLDDSNTEVGEYIMEIIHQKECFSKQSLQNARLYSIPFSYFMKLYFHQLHMNPMIESYQVPSNMDEYKDLLKKIKLFFQYTGIKMKCFGMGLLFHISITSIEGPDIKYLSGGSPTKSTFIRETTIREIFGIKKIIRRY
jgi:hypothetical protein